MGNFDLIKLGGYFRNERLKKYENIEDFENALFDIANYDVSSKMLDLMEKGEVSPTIDFLVAFSLVMYGTIWSDLYEDWISDCASSLYGYMSYPQYERAFAKAKEIDPSLSEREARNAALIAVSICEKLWGDKHVNSV